MGSVLALAESPSQPISTRIHQSPKGAKTARSSPQGAGSGLEVIIAVARLTEQILRTYTFNREGQQGKAHTNLEGKVNAQSQELSYLVRKHTQTEEQLRKQLSGYEAKLAEHEKAKRDLQALVAQQTEMYQSLAVEHSRIVPELQEKLRLVLEILNTLREQLKSKDEKLAQLQRSLNDVVNHPTPLEIQRAMKKLQYEDDTLNIAFAGQAGVGKSSLLNAIRGLSNTDALAAQAGHVETTMNITKYKVQLAGFDINCYDIPGAGTMNFSRYDYFKEQGLYIMNALIIIWQDRLLDTDLHLLSNCIKLKVQFFLVRTKCDQDLQDFLQDAGFSLNIGSLNSNDDSCIETLEQAKKDLKEQTTAEARKYIERAYEIACVKPPPEDLARNFFLVNKRSLYKWVTHGEEDLFAIDDKRLVSGIGKEIARRSQICAIGC